MKNNKKLMAVVNDELMMFSRNMYVDMVEGGCIDIVEAVASALKNYVTKDKRFIDAVGEKNAKQAQFDVSPVCIECGECGTENYFIQVVMFVGNQETDFHYEYYLADYPLGENVEDTPFVLYNNNGKSQLMCVFEACSNGITSAKTFKNGYNQLEPNEKTLEDIFSEILSEADMIVI